MADDGDERRVPACAGAKEPDLITHGGVWRSTMRLIALIPTAVILFASAPALAQDWMPFVSTDDGFGAVYPGEPNVEEISYVTLLGMPLPARVYSAEDANGHYSTTVVDYRGINELYEGARERCKAASGSSG